VINIPLFNSIQLTIIVLIVLILVIGSIVFIYLLLWLYNNNWNLNISYLYESNNYNYNKEYNVSDIPVLYYKKTEEGYVRKFTNVTECPSTITYHAENFSWRWVDEAKRMGWVQDNPPSAPSIIASKGMWEHIERILEEDITKYKKFKKEVKQP